MLFSDICFPFIVGFIFAYIFAPFVNYCSKRWRLPRPLLSCFLAIGVVMLFVLGMLEIIPRIRDYSLFLHDKIPEYYSLFISFLNDTFSCINISKADYESFQNELLKYTDQKFYVLASIVEGVASKTHEITRFFSFFVIMPISLFYFLRDWDCIHDTIIKCLPPSHREKFVEVCDIIRSTVKNLLYWQFYIVFSLFIYYSIFLRLVGVENNINLALMSGLFSFIPFIGCIFSACFVIFISIPTLTLSKFYFIVAIYFVGQFFEGYILYPHFVGKKIGLHPLWILFSFFAGIELDGIVGVLIAIPMAAIIRNLSAYLVGKFKATHAYKY
ncbi:MAG: AI-2E family transporter [Alphaproteobacteria bacterium]|nr:AI-2E family transporter [Alphaproteobacteria bacterium]